MRDIIWQFWLNKLLYWTIIIRVFACNIYYLNIIAYDLSAYEAVLSRWILFENSLSRFP